MQNRFRESWKKRNSSQIFCSILKVIRGLNWSQLHTQSKWKVVQSTLQALSVWFLTMGGLQYANKTSCCGNWNIIHMNNDTRREKNTCWTISYLICSFVFYHSIQLFFHVAHVNKSFYTYTLHSINFSC